MGPTLSSHEYLRQVRRFHASFHRGPINIVKMNPQQMTIAERLEERLTATAKLLQVINRGNYVSTLNDEFLVGSRNVDLNSPANISCEIPDELLQALIL